MFVLSVPPAQYTTIQSICTLTFSETSFAADKSSRFQNLMSASSSRPIFNAFAF
jgi:hypothetical protein